MRKLHPLVVVLAVVLGIAAPAAAHNKIAPGTPTIDLRYEIAAQEHVQTLPVFAGANAFDEVAHVELPPPSIADELARRFAATDVEPPSKLAIFSPTVSRKLALGPLGVFEENNVNGQSELGREPHLGLGYVRKRWLDPQTGTFLSPDPKGYVDSANLYSFAGGDPVNRRDPTGEDAYDDKLQGYIRWYSDQQGSMDQEYKRLQGAYKRAVATNNDVGLIVADINIIERQRMMFGGSVEGAATFIEYARSKGDATVLQMSYEDIYAEVVGDEAVRGVGSAVVGAFMPHAPAARQNLKRVTSRVVTAYSNSLLSSETGSIGPKVTNTPRAKRGPKPKGEGPHNLTIETRIQQIKVELGPEWEHVAGGMLKEQVILTPGGVKSARRPDITFRNRITGEVYHENIGKTYANGTAIKRETDAMNDLETATGKRPKYTPYDR